MWSAGTSTSSKFCDKWQHWAATRDNTWQHWAVSGGTQADCALKLVPKWDPCTLLALTALALTTGVKLSNLVKEPGCWRSK